MKDNNSSTFVTPTPGFNMENGPPPPAMYALICQCCGVILNNVEAYNEHFAAAHAKFNGTGNMIDACPRCRECDQIFPNREFLEIHVSHAHPNNDLNSHLNEAHGNMPSLHAKNGTSVEESDDNNQMDLKNCEQCDFKSGNADIIKYHAAVSHQQGVNNSNKDHKNGTIQKESRVAALLSLLSILTLKAPELANHISCPVCGFKTFEADKLTKHLRNFHKSAFAQNGKRKLNNIEEDQDMNDNNDDYQDDYETNNDLLVPKQEVLDDDDDDEDDKTFVVKPEMLECEVDIKPRRRGKRPGKKHKCDYCNEEFSSAHLFKRHVTKYHQDESEILHCKDCKKSFPSPTLLELHLKTHSKPKKCKVCSEKFDSIQDLMTHISSQHPEKAKNLQCTKCDYATHDETQLTNHVIAVHDFNIKGGTCPQCKRTFKNKHSVLAHVKRAHIHKEAVCPVCGKLVKEYILSRHLKMMHSKTPKKCFFCDFTGNTLHEHLRLCHPVPKDTFMCGACPLRFENADELERHHRHYHEPEERCPICQAMVPIKNLAGHISAAHDQGLEERCEYCDFKATLGVLARHAQDVHLPNDTRGQSYCKHCKIKIVYCKMQNHLQLAHPDKIEKFVCDDCGHTFEFEGNLRAHQKDIHPPNGLQKCYVCGKEVTKRSMNHHLSLYHDIGLVKKCKHCDFKSTFGQLKRHIAENHNEKVECDICHEVFRASVIRQHVRQAHVIGRIKCEHCELTFRTRWGKNEHVKTIHEKDKHAKKCPHCDYKTVFKYRLHWHIKGHQGLKPYSCEYCDYQVGKKKELMKHLLKMHGINKQT